MGVANLGNCGCGCDPDPEGGRCGKLTITAASCLGATAGATTTLTGPSGPVETVAGQAPCTILYCLYEITEPGTYAYTVTGPDGYSSAAGTVVFPCDGAWRTRVVDIHPLEYDLGVAVRFCGTTFPAVGATVTIEFEESGESYTETTAEDGVATFTLPWDERGGYSVAVEPPPHPEGLGGVEIPYEAGVSGGRADPCAANGLVVSLPPVEGWACLCCAVGDDPRLTRTTLHFTDRGGSGTAVLTGHRDGAGNFHQYWQGMLVYDEPEAAENVLVGYPDLRCCQKAGKTVWVRYRFSCTFEVVDDGGGGTAFARFWRCEKTWWQCGSSGGLLCPIGPDGWGLEGGDRYEPRMDWIEPPAGEHQPDLSTYPLRDDSGFPGVAAPCDEALDVTFAFSQFVDVLGHGRFPPEVLDDVNLTD